MLSNGVGKSAALNFLWKSGLKPLDDIDKIDVDARKAALIEATDK
jgi:hypothetical protein